jgi:hypothetical protein
MSDAQGPVVPSETGHYPYLTGQLAVLVIALLIGVLAYIAYRRGMLRSRGARFAVVVVVGLPVTVGLLSGWWDLL